MSSKGMMMVVSIYIILMIWCGSLDMQTTPGSNYGANQNPQTVFAYLLNFSNAFQHINVLGSIPLPVPNGSYFIALFAVLTLQFSVFSGANTLGYWVILSPWSFGFILGAVMLFVALIRGNISFG